MAGTIALQQRNGPSRLMRNTLRHSSKSVSHTVLLIPAMPALLTRMSILPSAERVGVRGARLKSQRPAAVDEMRDTGRERALVAGEVDGERSDFVRGAEPSHRLPRDEHVASAGAGRRGPLQHRGCFNRARADA